MSYNFSVFAIQRNCVAVYFNCRKLDTVVIYIINESFAAFAFAEISTGQARFCTFAS